MEARIVLRKKGGALVPVDDAGRAALAKIAEGRDILVKAHAPRNPRQHKLWWALMQKAWENQSFYATPDALCQAIKLALGHHDIMQLPTGKKVMLPKSISFGSMGQREFDLFFSAGLDLIVKHIIPGIDRVELQNELLELIGERRSWAA